MFFISLGLPLTDAHHSLGLLVSNQRHLPPAPGSHIACKTQSRICIPAYPHHIGGNPVQFAYPFSCHLFWKTSTHEENTMFTGVRKGVVFPRHQIYPLTPFGSTDDCALETKRTDGGNAVMRPGGILSTTFIRIGTLVRHGDADRRLPGGEFQRSVVCLGQYCTEPPTPEIMDSPRMQDSGCWARRPKNPAL